MAEYASKQLFLAISWVSQMRFQGVNGKCKMKMPIVPIDSTLYKMIVEKYIRIQNCSTAEKPKCVAKCVPSTKMFI